MLDLTPGPYKEGELPLITAERIVLAQFDAPAKLALAETVIEQLELVIFKQTERIAEFEDELRLAQEEIEGLHQDAAGESI